MPAQEHVGVLPGLCDVNVFCCPQRPGLAGCWLFACSHMAFLPACELDPAHRAISSKEHRVGSRKQSRTSGRAGGSEWHLGEGVGLNLWLTCQKGLAPTGLDYGFVVRALCWEVGDVNSNSFWVKRGPVFPTSWAIVLVTWLLD